jgi:D-glycero-alpha-D-manno-heptose 1-phosphate guanylyltransferase
MTALLLAGGMGTRIRHIHPDLPKPMVPVAGLPFLEWVVRYWSGQGIRHFVISLGHLAEVAQTYFRQRPDDGLQIETIVEPTALGTGGAVRYAADIVQFPETFVVANGDSLVAADTREAQAWMKEPQTDGVILGVNVPDTSRYGSLARDGTRLLGFREKQPGSGIINGGVYFLRRDILTSFSQKTPLSMESDVFPGLLAGGKHFRVAAVDAAFLDIGTPESLAAAADFVQQNFGQAT